MEAPSRLPSKLLEELGCATVCVWVAEPRRLPSRLLPEPEDDVLPLIAPESTLPRAALIRELEAELEPVLPKSPELLPPSRLPSREPVLPE